MASKQFLRRLPLLAREGWSSANAGALPEVAQDLTSFAGPASSLGIDSPRPPLPTSRPIAAVGQALAGLPRATSKAGVLPQTLGQWSQRISHLQPLQKPLTSLGVAAAAAAEVSRPPWPQLAITATRTASPTSVAVATLPAVADILKHHQQLASVAVQPTSVPVAPAAESDAVLFEAPVATQASESGSAAVTSQLVQPEQTAQQFSQQTPLRRSFNGRSSGSSNAISISLNKHIMACRTTEDLLGLVQMRGAQFDYFNVSTALARVPKLVAGSSGAFTQPGALPPPSGRSSMTGGHGMAGALASGMPPACPMGADVHVDASGRALLDLLAALMVTQVHSFDARGLANSAWAFGKLKYVPSGGLPAVIASAALRRLPEFSPQNLSNLVWSFVYMHHADEQLLTAASRMLQARVNEFKPQELANIVWAFASLGHKDEQMMHVVSNQAQRIAPLFKEQELSNVLWALGKMGLRGRPDVFDALMAETRAKLPAFLPQGISNVAWALASVGHADARFLDQVVAQCLGGYGGGGAQLAAFDAQALANLVWAMASMGYYHPPFIAAVLNECLGRGLDRLSPQNLSNILWGCATLGHRDPRMLSAWAAQTLEKLASFEPQGLSNTAWAFARLGYHGSQLFAALGAAAQHKLDSFTPQGLSNLAWALATAGSEQPRLFEGLCRAAAASAAAFNAQHVSVLLWACASLRHTDAPLFDAMLGRLAEVVEGPEGGCEPQNVANALWAAARMGHVLRPEHASPLLRHVSSMLPAMGQQELCNSMWALAALDLMDERLFASCCDCLAARGLGEISAEGIHQAYHAQLMFHSNLARAAGVPLAQLQRLQEQRAAAAKAAPGGAQAPGPLLPCLPEPLHSVAAGMWAASARDVRVSRFHEEVSGALAAAGVPHAVEWLTEDEHFSVDIGMQVNAQPTAVEVNGAHHYASNAPSQPLGDTATRRRLLQDRGWHVVDVGLADWQAMGRSAAERGTSLVGRIAASLKDYDWQYAGLPLTGKPSAVTTAADPAMAAAAAGLTADVGMTDMQDWASVGSLLAAQQQQQLQQLQQAQQLASLAGWLGGTNAWALAGLLGGAGANAAAGASAAAGLGLGLSLGGLGAGGAPAASMERTGSVGADAVASAVAAAEALGALPGGNLLLAQQVYDVLGLSLPGAPLPAAPIARSGSDLVAAALMGMAAESSGSLTAGAEVGSGSASGSASEVEDELSDEDLERVVQYALQ